MQSQTDSIPQQLTVFSLPGLQNAADLSVKAPCPTTARMLELFEEITGWRAEFEESKASYRNRSQVGMENEPAEGTFSIVDMSANWPANKLTCHRGKCDQLVELVGELVADLQATKLELRRTRSAMAGFTPDPFVDDDEILVDSFVPKFGRVETDHVTYQDQDAFVEFENSATTEADDEFEVCQELSSGGTMVAPPFDGWALGGSTGIVGDVYLDWMVDQNERIAISVGKIESAFGNGDSESIIKVDPLTSEFRITSRGDLQSCYLWDSAAESVIPMKESDHWTHVKVGDAIIATTDLSVDLAELSRQFQQQANVNLTAERIAELASQCVENDNRVMVLKRT